MNRLETKRQQWLDRWEESQDDCPKCGALVRSYEVRSNPAYWEGGSCLYVCPNDGEQWAVGRRPVTVGAFDLDENLLRAIYEPHGMEPVERWGGGCWRRLVKPNHRCNSQSCYGDNRLPHGGGMFDHVVWLRAKDRSRWAVLSQPYGLDRERIDEWCNTRCLVWQECGAAPYGFGTTAFLILGAVAEVQESESEVEPQYTTDGRMRILPPLKDWARPRWCDLLRESPGHIAVKASYGRRGRWSLDDLVRPGSAFDDWWKLDDLIQPRNAPFNGWWLIPKRNISATINAFERAGALGRLVIRALPDAANCKHKRCAPKLDQMRRERVSRVIEEELAYVTATDGDRRG